MPLTDHERAMFAALADVVIPGDDAAPAARAVQTHAQWLDRALTARPDLVSPLQTILAKYAHLHPVEALARLAADDPAGAEQLLLVMTCAYFMNPRVRRRLRYPGQVATPIREDESDWFLRDDLLAPVIERGSIYRST